MVRISAAWARNSPAERQEKGDDPLFVDSGGLCISTLISVSWFVEYSEFRLGPRQELLIKLIGYQLYE
jgi:hypothetical protein